MVHRIYIGKIGNLKKDDLMKVANVKGTVKDFLMKETYAFAV